MSTRCQIAIEGSPVYVYKHSDGYPAGVLPVLLPFRDRFYEGRGYDPEYFLARLLMAFGVEERTDAAHTLANPDPSDPYYKYAASHARKVMEGKEVLSYGIDTVIHGDIEFFYWVGKDGTVRVHARGYGDSDRHPKHWPVSATYQRGELFKEKQPGPIPKLSEVRAGDQVRWDGDRANPPHTYTVTSVHDGWIGLKNATHATTVPAPQLTSPRWHILPRES
jgi:hypothetical protein